MTQMMGTTALYYTNFANHYYAQGNDACGEIWRMTYWNQGMNLENMINQSLAVEDWTLAGIGYAIKAYSWDMLAKEHAELPMKQAFVDGLLSDGRVAVLARIGLMAGAGWYYHVVYPFEAVG